MIRHRSACCFFLLLSAQKRVLLALVFTPVAANSCVCVCVFIQLPMAASPAPQSPARRSRLLDEWEVIRDGIGGHRPGPVPYALVTTEPKQGNLVLWQSGVLACDLRAVVHSHAAGFRVRVDPDAGRARATSACGRSQVALTAHRRAAFCRN